MQRQTSISAFADDDCRRSACVVHGCPSANEDATAFGLCFISSRQAASASAAIAAESTRDADMGRASAEKTSTGTRWIAVVSEDLSTTAAEVYGGSKHRCFEFLFVLVIGYATSSSVCGTAMAATPCGVSRKNYMGKTPGKDLTKSLELEKINEVVRIDLVRLSIDLWIDLGLMTDLCRMGVWVATTESTVVCCAHRGEGRGTWVEWHRTQDRAPHNDAPLDWIRRTVFAYLLSCF